MALIRCNLTSFSPDRLFNAASLIFSGLVVCNAPVKAREDLSKKGREKLSNMFIII